MKEKIKILLVDDHQLIIDGIKNSLSFFNNLEIETTNNCDSALLKIKTNEKNTPFDIVFTDLSFDNTTIHTVLKNGEDLIKELKKKLIAIKIAVITGHIEINRVFNVITNLDPDAYILKENCNSEELNYAIKSLMMGEKYYSHKVHQKILKRNIVQIQMDNTAIQILKELPKQNKISNLEGIIKNPNGETIKIRAIEKRIAQLKINLNANNNIDLVLKAKELGIID